MKRHDLIYLKPAAWPALRQQASGLGIAQHYLDNWETNGWPLVMARQPKTVHEENGPITLTLGMPLPPHPSTGQRQRYGLAVDNHHIAITTGADLLENILRHAPSHWHSTLAQLVDTCKPAGLALRTYGSLALQARTGYRYLDQRSDIDLLIDLSGQNDAQISLMIDILKHYSSIVPLDGEFVFGHLAVSWKEFARQAKHADALVLAKSLSDVKLVAINDLRKLAQIAPPGKIEAAPCMA